MQGLFATVDCGSESFGDGLMSEADTENRFTGSQFPDNLQDVACGGRYSRPRRYDDGVVASGLGRIYTVVKNNIYLIRYVANLFYEMQQIV
ncbi:hypothetical protein I180019D1_27900 [Alistipes sp. i18-0019-D1]